MSTSHVVIITGTIPLDLNVTSKALAYFIKLGSQIQSSNLHETTFLYTLIKPNGFLMHDDRCLKTLEGTERSAAFSITYA
jgi:hypothetical protein